MTMSISSIEKKEFIEFLAIVKLRLKSHNQSLTKNKQFILEILYDNLSHLSVEEIVEIAKQHSVKLPMTTIYRTLSSFEAFGVVDTILVDDKKRYELIYFKKPHYHLYCGVCHKILEFSSIDIHNSFLEELAHMDFTPTNFNVIINGVCKECQNNKN